MKNRKILDVIGNIDERFVEEARPTGGKKKSIWLKLGALAACICLIVAAGAALFTPYSTTPPDVSEYEGSEYYVVIQKLNEANFVKPYFANAFESIIGSIGSIFELLFDGAVSDSPEDSGPSMSPEENYQEVTDNQVSGVIEADIIKRTDKYIYYMRAGRIDVYSISGSDSEIVGCHELDSHGKDCEMYLSDDGRILTVIATVHAISKPTSVTVTALDVSSPENITLVNEFSITGSYISSRKVGGKILLMSEFYTGENPDFSKPESFVPTVTSGGVDSLIPAESIVAPDKLSTTRYTVVTALSEGSLELLGCEAFLSYSDSVYVSQDNIYVTRTYNQSREDGSLRHNKTCTEISVMRYSGDALTHLGSVSVDGYTKDQYSIDELNGVLRVVTTTSNSSYYTDSFMDNVSSDDEPLEIPDGVTLGSNTSASLYCIDLASLEIIASVEGFAPNGETVRSVRFNGDFAYVCTSYMTQDPVFFFDLSSIENITYKDTGTIPGLSTSLIQLGNGFLLGVGIEDWSTVKIEIYEQNESAVVSVCSYKVKDAYYSEVYKSYFIDRENGLFGLGVNVSGESRYVLLHFDGYALREVINVKMDGSRELMRALLTDGYFYIFSDDDFKVINIH